mmetsp:Transcript_5997/g.23734  ORF Transcript_5997/g.23734 Transcript_5997/m.23734 type:complete len:213 (-) Transcript_5997:1730-2368(-)
MPFGPPKTTIAERFSCRYTQKVAPFPDLTLKFSVLNAFRSLFAHSCPMTRVSSSMSKRKNLPSAGLDLSGYSNDVTCTYFRSGSSSGNTTTSPSSTFESPWSTVDPFGFTSGIVPSAGALPSPASPKLNVFDNCLSIDGCFLNTCTLCSTTTTVVFSAAAFIRAVTVPSSSAPGFNRFAASTKRSTSAYSPVLLEHVDAKSSSFTRRSHGSV